MTSVVVFAACPRERVVAGVRVLADVDRVDAGCREQPAVVTLVHRGLWHSVADGAVVDEPTREILGLPPGA